MTYIKWKDEVESYLYGMSEEEKRKVFSYFAEMYADKRDAGKSEAQIVEEFGAPYDVAKKILSDSRENAGAGTANRPPVTPPPTYSEPSYTPPPVYTAPAYTPPPPPNNGYPQTAEAGAPAKKRRRGSGKGWIIALCVVLSILFVGLILFLVEVARNDWKLTVTYETREYTATQEFGKLDLNLSVGSMNVDYFDGDTIEVSYPTSSYFGYTVSERGGVLTVKPRSGFRMFLFGTGKIPAVTVRVPRDMALELSFDVSAGSAYVGDMNFSLMEVDVSAGSFTASKIKCDSFNGDLSAGRMSFSQLTCKSFGLDVSAGTANVGKLFCESVTTDVSAGTVNLTLDGRKSDYSIKVSKSAGSCNVDSQTGSAAGKMIVLDISAGTVTVNFTD